MEISESIQIMKALSDHSRLMIMNSLLEQSQYVEELSERFNLSAPTVSFHLKKLGQANLVRKEKIKKQYLTRSIDAGVFLLTNNITKKVYIGSSSDLKITGYRLIRELNNGSHPNFNLQKDWNRFGKENFCFQIAAKKDGSGKFMNELNKELKIMEKMCIKRLRISAEQRYNRRTI